MAEAVPACQEMNRTGWQPWHSGYGGDKLGWRFGGRELKSILALHGKRLVHCMHFWSKGGARDEQASLPNACKDHVTWTHGAMANHVRDRWFASG